MKTCLSRFSLSATTIRLFNRADMVLSFYEQNISYKDLTPEQAKNITVAAVELANANRAGRDISKYRAAMEKYLKEAVMLDSEYTPEKADEHVRMLLGD